jgi:hypothetical protein
MIAFSKYSSAVIEIGKRIIKASGIGGSAMTAKECVPFGIDGQPREGWTAIYAETTNKSETVILGYINKNQLAEAGELRLYSVAESGASSAFVFLKAGGEIWLNSNQYSAVKFEPLQTAVNAQNVDINAELAKISIALAGLGVTYTVDPVTSDLSSVKSDKVKLI